MWALTAPRRVSSSSSSPPSSSSTLAASNVDAPVKSSSSSSEPDLLVLSFRSHHNAYTEGDGSGALVERYPCPTSFSFQVIQFIFSFVIVHYLLYWVLMLAVLYALYALGYGWLSLAVSLLYLRSYADGAQFEEGRVWEWFRQNRLWYLSHQYTELEVVRTAKLDPQRKYIFAVYPHGILIISRIGLYGGTFERLFPGVDTRTLGASPMFWVPGAREICLWMGAVDARKKTAERVLRTRDLSLFIYPGGSKEIFLTNPHSSVTTLIARRGFVRLALEHGCQLVPVLVFREKYMYRVWTPPRAVVAFFLRVLRTPVLLFSGRYFTWLPFHTYMSIVFDRPIEVQRNSAPTEEEVEALWQQYRKALVGLWDRYKTTYGYGPEETLEIREAHEPADRSDAAAADSNNGRHAPHSTHTGSSSSQSKRKE